MALVLSRLSVITAKLSSSKSQCGSKSFTFARNCGEFATFQATSDTLGRPPRLRQRSDCITLQLQKRPANQHPQTLPMDNSLPSLWHSAKNGAFVPAVGKPAQFYVGFILLLVGISLSAFFALNRSVVNLPVVGVPASAVIAFGTIYMFCAVGVYV